MEIKTEPPVILANVTEYDSGTAAQKSVQTFAFYQDIVCIRIEKTLSKLYA